MRKWISIHTHKMSLATNKNKTKKSNSKQLQENVGKLYKHQKL